MLVLAAGSLSAKPIVSYSVSGSVNNWTLDFTVNNTTNQDLYVFGVLLGEPNVTGTPTGWNSTVYPARATRFTA